MSGRVAMGVRSRSTLAVLVFALVAVWLRAETVTVATYNVQNYVAANRMVEGVYRENYPKPEAEKRALRAVIRRLNADVLAIQEMGSRAYLQELQRDLAKEGMDYPHAEVLEAADPDRHLAVLSRKPLVAVGRHTGLKFKYFGAEEEVKRGMLEVRISTEAGELAIFVVHLKSRYTDRPDDPESAKRRTQEATAARDRVLKIFPNPATSKSLIVGDFNDGPGSKTLGFFMRRGKTEIAVLLPGFDSRGETWTHFYRKEDVYSHFDHILVSAPLQATVTKGQSVILDDPEVRTASDHRPVLVTLELKKDSN